MITHMLNKIHLRTFGVCVYIGVVLIIIYIAYLKLTEEK